jgi:hypothetical protein
VLGIVLVFIDFFVPVLSPIYRWLLPSYETKVALTLPEGEIGDPVILNKDEDVVVRALITRNEESYEVTDCMWQLDGVDMPETHLCSGWYLQFSDPKLHLDFLRKMHEIIATPVGGYPASERKIFVVRPFVTPRITIISPNVEPPTLYLSEKARLSFQAGTGQPTSCQWLPAESGIVRPLGASGCDAEYQAPDRLKNPPEAFDVVVRATGTIDKWPDASYSTQLDKALI